MNLSKYRSALLAAALVSVAGLASAQTAGTVTLTVSPANCTGSCAATASWGTSPTATSCTASDSWTGTKAATGSQSVGTVTTTSKFTLTCTWPGATPPVTLSWTPPTLNTDNSALIDLASYRIHYGTNSAMSSTQTVSDPTASSANVAVPTVGTWMFTVGAVNSKGAESDPSNLATKVVTAASGPSSSASATVTVSTVPQPPTNLTATVALAINIPLDSHDGFNRTLAYTVSGGAPGVVAGFVKIGTPVTSAPVFTYRGQTFCTFLENHPRTGALNIEYYGKKPAAGTIVVAPCA